MDNRLKLLKIFDAISEDDYVVVRKILHNNYSSNIKIPSDQLCGLAILAAENHATNITNEFYNYNLLAKDSNLSKYLLVASKINNNKKMISKIVHSEMMH